MFQFALSNSNQARIRQILCLGAHSDDIEIGCGGTLLKLISLDSDLTIYWVVLGARGQREQEAFRSANRLLADVDDKKVIVKGFRDGFFPYLGLEIKEYFEQLKRDISPDLT